MLGARVVTGLRDAWLILGLSLALFLALEGLYRGERAIRTTLRGSSAAAPLPPGHPYTGLAWYSDFARSYEASRVPIWTRGRYDPYRGWWARPYASKYINIDSAGRRVTVQVGTPVAGRLRLFLLGGSTMWGIARDSSTIPSLVAAELQARGVRNVEVVNLAQMAYVSTQETITLLLELRRGNIPAAAVFLDGYNDIATVFRAGEPPGSIMNEALFAQPFDFARSGVWTGLLMLGERSLLVTRLATLVRSRSNLDRWRMHPAQDSLCRNVAEQYAHVVRSVDAWGRAFGFRPLFLWQPMLATTHKPLTVWERSIAAPSGYRETLRRCTGLADSLMADRVGQTYFPLHSLFDDHPESVYLDDWGHVTEAGNRVIALRIVDILAPVLGWPRRRVH